MLITDIILEWSDITFELTGIVLECSDIDLK